MSGYIISLLIGIGILVIVSIAVLVYEFGLFVDGDQK
jgi:hypothetical protein